jgi:hypothetical protein
MVKYITTGSVSPTTNGADEASTEESLLPTGAGDMEVDDVDDENLNADHNDGASLRFHNMSDILATSGFTSRALVAEELHVVSSDEPTSFAEAERSPSWRKAIMEEMDSIEENDTLEPHRSPTRSQADRGEVGVQGEAGRARGGVQTQGTPCSEGLHATTWHRLR